mmetsp:Transcript_8411/g.35195  ORF Transcript_8411/g.35195 Transcript_8411/m.35195 type:complete len:307 (+) Transcript_8411:433-1353(+)
MLGCTGGFSLCVSKCFLVAASSSAKAAKSSEVSRSAHRPTGDFASPTLIARSASIRSTNAVRSARALSTDKVMAFWNRTSRSFTPRAKALKSSCHDAAATSSAARAPLFRSASVILEKLSRTSSKLFLISNPVAPPKTGGAVRGANCACASHTSSKSLHLCSNASSCANSELCSQGQRIFGSSACILFTAARVNSKDVFHASHASMEACSASTACFTFPSSMSPTETSFAHRRITSLEIFRSKPNTRSWSYLSAAFHTSRTRCEMPGTRPATSVAFAFASASQGGTSVFRNRALSSAADSSLATIE